MRSIRADPAWITAGCFQTSTAYDTKQRVQELQQPLGIGGHVGERKLVAVGDSVHVPSAGF
jgi:hypothetical protein